MKLELEINSMDELKEVSKSILNFCDATKIILFEASMGAGKTTLIKELCKSLGSKDNFSSPTYSIVNEYDYPNGKIFHFDLYRLKNINELLDIGFEEYIFSKNYCLIEWPILAMPFIETPYIKCEIEAQQNIRYLRCTKF